MNLGSSILVILSFFSTFLLEISTNYLLFSNDGDFNINTRFDSDGSDFLHGLQGGSQINDTLVNAHFETIPGLGTFTTRSFTGGDTEDLGGHTSGTTGLNFLLGSLRDQIAAS
jgi:hypothetical protein